MMFTIKMSWHVCDKGVVSGSAAGSRPVQADGAGGDDCANEVSFLLVTWDESAWSVLCDCLEKTLLPNHKVTFLCVK